MRRVPVLLTFALLLLLAAPLAAEEAGPAEPGDVAVPAPADVKTFSLAADLVRSGQRTAAMTAFVQRAGEGYEVGEAITYDDTTAGTVAFKAECDAGLHVLSGTYLRRNQAGFLSASWKRDGAALRMDYKTQEYENQLEVKEGRGARTSLIAVLFLAHHAPKKRATYVWRDFDADPPAGDTYVVEAKLECHGKASWRVGDDTVAAWVYSFTRGKRTYRFAFNAESGAFAGLEVVGMNLALTPTGVTRVGLDAAADASLLTPTERARRRAQAIRRKMPASGEGWRFEGELWLGEYHLGTARLAVEASSIDGEPAWLITERTQRVAGEAVVTSELTAFLGPDLRVLRGESRHAAPSGTSVSTYERRGSAIVTRHHGANGSTGMIAHPANHGATIGLASVVMFLGHVPETPQQYVLPGFDPRYVTTPKAGAGRFPQDVADLFVEVKGPSGYSTGLKLVRTLSARVSSKTGRRYTVHVDRSTRRLVAVVGGLPSLTIGPKGVRGAKPDFFDTDRESPRSAYECFIRFGRGYHLPRRDYLSKAFHWKRMLAHDVKAGHYTKDTSLAAYREDWIKEFVSRSKNRTVGDCDDLLVQILMTSKETHLPDGGIRIQTLPAYGGHAYTIQQVGGNWFITAID